MKPFPLYVILVGTLICSRLTVCAAPIGQPVPDAPLVDSDGKKHTLSELKGDGKLLVVGFFSPRCPYNKGRWERIAALAKEFQDKNVQFVGINPNPKETLAEVVAEAKKHDIEYPILRDEGKGLVKALDAKGTPHMFVFDQKGILRFAGAFDDNIDASKVKEQFCKEAIAAVLSGKEVAVPDPHKFIGCSIKD